MPASLSSVGGEPPRAAEPTAPAERRRQHSSRFPRSRSHHAHRCSLPDVLRPR